ncbi:hypothetical protein XENOCAPTIV_022562 [Xenoophorus captivus]|uniref:Uncharacterized protein n=1 Tax=Xenoophorus captivus TaxID=1517983 RepID=A0ABV0SH14_9TELE
MGQMGINTERNNRRDEDLKSLAEQFSFRKVTERSHAEQEEASMRFGGDKTSKPIGTPINHLTKSRCDQKVRCGFQGIPQISQLLEIRHRSMVKDQIQEECRGIPKQTRSLSSC